MVLRAETVQAIEAVLADWNTFCYRYSSDYLDANVIEGRFGVSRATAYLIKHRSEYLKKNPLKGGVEGGNNGFR